MSRADQTNLIALRWLLLRLAAIDRGDVPPCGAVGCSRKEEDGTKSEPTETRPYHQEAKCKEAEFPKRIGLATKLALLVSESEPAGRRWRDIRHTVCEQLKKQTNR